MNINRLRSSVRRGARRGFWLGALCWAWGVQAQPAQVVQLPEVVVTATRVNTPLEDVVRDVTVLGREEIEASGASTLVELLGRLPGVVGVGDARLYIRGAEARMTAVYVDGVRVDRQDALTPGGGAPWDVLPLDDVERIEVLRGTASSLYGSDGMGGVVLISTASEDQSTRATLGLGSSQGRLVGLKLKRASGEIRASLALASEQNDGYDERPDLVHSPANLPQQSSQASGAIHFGQRDTGGEVTLGFRRGWDRRTSVDNNWDGTGSNYLVVQNLSLWHVSWSRQQGVQGTDLSFSQSTFGYGDSVSYFGEQIFKVHTATLTAQQHGRIGATRWRLGYEGKNDSYKSQAWTDNPAVNASRAQSALYGGLGLPIGQGLVNFDARYDSSDSDAEVVTGSVSAGYTLGEWQLRGAIGSGYRLPTLSQRFSQYGSASVRPETSVGAELSAQHGDLTQGKTTVTVYQQRFRDLIIDDQFNSSCAYGRFCATNIEQALVKGWTIARQQAWGAWLGAASVDGLLAKNDGGSNQGKDLNLRPRLSWQASLQRQWAAVNASIDYQRWSLHLVWQGG
ncbi:MAG: TonB-dependent receptor [Betaproteobacteria bacterium]|nr:TonB-dependent receptor [Candidatus Fonsibacter lacus]